MPNKVTKTVADEIADDLDRLKAELPNTASQVVGGLTEEQESSIMARLTRHADRLRALAADPHKMSNKVTKTVAGRNPVTSYIGLAAAALIGMAGYAQQNPGFLPDSIDTVLSVCSGVGVYLLGRFSKQETPPEPEAPVLPPPLPPDVFPPPPTTTTLR